VVLEVLWSFRLQLGSARGAGARYIGPATSRRVHLATPNYSYEKRQRELAKKRKAEEKRQRKLNGKPEEAATPDEPRAEGEAATDPDTPAEPQT
jgi:hypothetical protein